MTNLSPREVAYLEERRQARATVEVAGEGESVADGEMAFGGIGSWANQACGLGLDGPVAESELDRLVQYYTSRGVEPRIEVCAFADESLLRGLATRGFVLREFEDVLARQFGDVQDLRALHPYGWPAGVKLERVDPADDRQVEEHARVSLSGFCDDEPSAALLATARRTVRHPKAVAFNAVVDGKTVGAGGLDLRAESSTLYGVSVLPEARRRGIQLALILERLQFARDHGCPLATIHSRPGMPTARNAARVGFSLCYAKAILAAPGPGLVPSP